MVKACHEAALAAVDEGGPGVERVALRHFETAVAAVEPQIDAGMRAFYAQFGAAVDDDEEEEEAEGDTKDAAADGAAAANATNAANDGVDDAEGAAKAAAAVKAAKAAAAKCTKGAFVCPPQLRLVVVFSGKRKSGKDYVTDSMLARLGAGRAEIGRLSAPLKRVYAEERGLDYARLLSAGPYKERYRKDMIVWGEARRQADPGFFAREVVAGSAAPVLIVSDARRPTDLAFFHELCGAQGGDGTQRPALLTVRVEASEATRAARGWVFTAGVDDVSSECGLDGRSDWGLVVPNEGGPGSGGDATARAAREAATRAYIDELVARCAAAARRGDDAATCVPTAGLAALRLGGGGGGGGLK